MTTKKIRIVMHYEFKLKNSSADAAHNINRAYGNNTVCKRTVQRLYRNLIPGMNPLA